MTAASPVLPHLSPEIGTYRERLRSGAAALFERFDHGIAVDQLVRQHSQLVDGLLCDIWQRHIPADCGAALIAVGGYGRQELHPASDVDILILIAPEGVTKLDEAVEQFVTLLFDVGLQPGHSVRTVDECIRIAGEDVTVVTNLIEARLLIGDERLFDAMRNGIAADQIWPSDAFFSAKVAEQHERWHKYGDTAYNLEPNIKENPGGLRDIQMIGWVAKRHFAAETLHDLVGHGFLTEDEYDTAIAGQDLLWRIRFALHRINGRCEDRLLFDYQRALAEEFGFRDGPNNLAVEQLMQQYYRAVMELNRLNEMLLQLFEEAILLHDRLGPPVPINRRFQSRSGYLEVTDEGVFRRHPRALLEVFLILQLHPDLQGVRASTIRLIREHRHLIDERFRADLGARSLFMEILRQPIGINRALRRMNRYGVLAAYIPAFANIVGRMQYDLFHVYTVDEHTLILLRNLRRYTVPELAEELPLCTAIAHRIPKLELLYLAGLFHDIAKGRLGDHSRLGAQEAWDFCRLHGLSEFDAGLVSWLVAKHLLMSITVQRKDISDMQVVQTFAAEVGDPTRLDYLYLLTVADVRGTNPKRWNSWRDALLSEIYHNTRAALLRGLDNPQAQDELIAQKRSEALRLLRRRDADPDACAGLWRGLSRDFFLLNSPDEIAWQTLFVLGARRSDLPIVRIRPHTARGGTEIFIYTRDCQSLFATTTATLDQLGLTIMDARIQTTDGGMTLDSYQVLDPGGRPVEDPARLTEIRTALESALIEEELGHPEVARRMPRQYKHFPIQTRISFTADEANQRTVMHLTTLDRPGLLAAVGSVFEACDVRLRNAKIATIGAEVEDVFFITSVEGAAITCDHDLACLREEIHRRLEQTPEH